jgi:hypothetical protein
MIINITICTTDDGPLTPTEKAILRALGSDEAVGPPPVAATGTEFPAGTVVSVTTDPPAKAAPRKAAPKTSAAKVDPDKVETKLPVSAMGDYPFAPNPVASEPDPAVDEDAKMEMAVSRAAAMISEGNAADVRAILADVGVKRVSELSGDALDDFLART